MKIARLTPQGKVISALWDAPARFGELKVATGLSGAWLDRTLKQLHREGLIEYDVVNKMYAVKSTEQLQSQVDAVTPIYLSEVATMTAEELAKDDRVQAVVLFGSVAMGKATGESDVDLLVVLGALNHKVEDEFKVKLSELGFKFRVTIEPTLLGLDDLKATLAANVGLIFGLARGYEVLYDRTRGLLTKLVEKSVARVRNDYMFVKEGEVWLLRRELTAKA
jgi:predicted nucleotidyltransferase